MMNKDELIEIGFKELPHFTVMGSVEFDLGRNRTLSVGSVGTPNEIIFLLQRNGDDPKKVDDLVCVHNYDYDGFATIEKVKALINSISFPFLSTNK